MLACYPTSGSDYLSISRTKLLVVLNDLSWVYSSVSSFRELLDTEDELIKLSSKSILFSI